MSPSRSLRVSLRLRISRVLLLLSSSCAFKSDCSAAGDRAGQLGLKSLRWYVGVHLTSPHRPTTSLTKPQGAGLTRSILLTLQFNEPKGPAGVGGAGWGRRVSNHRARGGGEGSTNPRMVTCELSRVGCCLRRRQQQISTCRSQEGGKSLSRAENDPRRLSQTNPPPPLQEHARVLVFFCVFLFLACSNLEDPHAVFPALSVFSNMAQLNVLDPSFWFEDIVAAKR